MPDSRSNRWYFVLGMMGALFIMVVVLSIIGFGLRAQVHDLQADARAEKLAARTAEVATCYASARGRPRLIVILRLLANTAERDPIGRAAVDEFIMEYENSTPTLAECDKRAVENGFSPKDFPPSNRGEEGNGR